MLLKKVTQGLKLQAFIKCPWDPGSTKWLKSPVRMCYHLKHSRGCKNNLNKRKFRLTIDVRVRLAIHKTCQSLQLNKSLTRQCTAGMARNMAKVKMFKARKASSTSIRSRPRRLTSSNFRFSAFLRKRNRFTISTYAPMKNRS